MAAGLPQVVSDWDGYRDTVRHGVDGFRVPTLMPVPGMGEDLALRHATGQDTYDMYCGLTSSLVAVDIEAAAKALACLARSTELRAQMGAAGRRRAREVYEWAVVIRQYEAMWERLNHLRQTLGHPLDSAQPAWPARLDPFYSFQSYPTQAMGPDSVIGLAYETPERTMEALQACQTLAMVNFSKEVQPSEEVANLIVQALSSGPQELRALAECIAPEQRQRAMRSVAWMIKMGLVTFPQQDTSLS
jgi:hypothetical protein